MAGCDSQVIVAHGVTQAENAGLEDKTTELFIATKKDWKQRQAQREQEAPRGRSPSRGEQPTKNAAPPSSRSSGRWPCAASTGSGSVGSGRSKGNGLYGSGMPALAQATVLGLSAALRPWHGCGKSIRLRRPHEHA